MDVGAGNEGMAMRLRGAGIGEREKKRLYMKYFSFFPLSRRINQSNPPLEIT